MNAHFVVTLTPAHYATVTVSFATATERPSRGQDYSALGGTLTFTPGQTIQTISVPVTATASVSRPKPSP